MKSSLLVASYLRAALASTAALLGACSPSRPPEPPAKPAPSQAPVRPALPVLGELPALSLRLGGGEVVGRDALLGKPLLLWLHHPAAPASVEQASALDAFCASNSIRTIMLIPVENASAALPALSPTRSADPAPCPPDLRTALGGLRAIPTVLLVDAKGNIRIRQEGQLDLPALADALKQLQDP